MGDVGVKFASQLKSGGYEARTCQVSFSSPLGSRAWSPAPPWTELPPEGPLCLHNLGQTSHRPKAGGREGTGGWEHWITRGTQSSHRPGKTSPLGHLVGDPQS